MAVRGATKESWNWTPMPGEREEIPYEDTFTADEMDLISQGYIPEAMEEKWFIYFADEWLYLHRSWTGYCYYMVQLEKTGDSFQVAQAFVNRNEQEKKAEDPVYEAQQLKTVIHLLLLGNYVYLPNKDGQSDTDHALSMWSLVGNAMIPKDYRF